MAESGRLKIGFISRFDLNDRAAASGSFYSMAQALQKYCGEVVPLFPLYIPARQIRRVAKGVMVYLLGKSWDYERTEVISKSYAKQINRLLSEVKVDLLFAPMGSIAIANLRTNLPVVLLGDATYSAMLKFNPRFRGFYNRHMAIGNAIEKKALDRADLILYSSDWSAESAIKEYQIDTNKIRIISLGANLDYVPSWGELSLSVRPDFCTLLFLAVDWQLKGGDIVLETYSELNRKGLSTRLIICGCSPKYLPRDKNIQIMPFLNKNNPEDLAKIDAILRQVDILIHPARFEAFGIVLAEANAYGIPVLASEVGGIPSAVQEGKNGFLFPLSARGSDYAKVILNLFTDVNWYHEMRRNARRAYEEKLNWRSWACSFNQALQEVLRIDPVRLKHPAEVSA